MGILWPWWALELNKSQGLVEQVLQEVARISSTESGTDAAVKQKSEKEIFVEELQDLGLNEKIKWGGTVYTKVFGPIALWTLLHQCNSE